MTGTNKNLMVGATMLVALVLLGFMLVKFGATPIRLLSHERMPVEFDCARADGVSVGSTITYLGVEVGTVARIHRSADDQEVIIDANIDNTNPPPANVIGRIRSQLVGGGSSLSLDLTGPQPVGKLQAHQKIQAVFVGVDLLPPEIGQLANELRLTAEQLRKSDIMKHLDEAIVTVRTQVQNAGKVIDDLDRLVGDERAQQDVKAALANFRAASDSATRIANNLEKFSTDLQTVGTKVNKVADGASETIQKTQAHLDDLSSKINDRLLQVAKLLETFQSISTKVDQGKGTAGLLVNDGKLYDSLVNTAQQLNLTIADLKRLVEQWEEEGVSLKLGGRK